ncbi:hypothetical protein [Halorubrum sp. FL23]|uniref:hypothetical protein n=1 Tax=Halorubrum sp. FL23 TaxID=3458704 RepID=UPI0040349DAA
MANRRKFIAGLGALATGSAAAVGTGAFTSVQAERDLKVETAGDANALLGISPYDGPNGQYANVQADSTVDIDFTSNDNATDVGLNKNANTNIENVLQITNNGTQDVRVNVAIEDEDGNIGGDVASGLEIGISGDKGGGPTSPDFARLGPDYDGELLGAGESAGLGFFFFLNDSTNVDEVINDVEQMYIVAAADGELPDPEDL